MKKWIFFDEIKLPDSELWKKKTKVWNIVSKESNDVIGCIKWYGPWRKYCFFPSEESVYEQVCLRDIATFIETETKKHREFSKRKLHVFDGIALIPDIPNDEKGYFEKVRRKNETDNR